MFICVCAKRQIVFLQTNAASHRNICCWSFVRSSYQMPKHMKILRKFPLAKFGLIRVFCLTSFCVSESQKQTYAAATNFLSSSKFNVN